ncbi:MAG: penicillin-binding protein 2 [Melioribacteraceae bacterium]|nr:penicillin-binding protein 2 [Melioribacteraceae bacterium]
MMDTGHGTDLRRKIIQFIIVAFIGLIVFQLFRMQVIEYEVYTERSRSNSIKAIKLNSPRGVFYDRNLKVLVSNQPTYTIQITPSDYSDSLNSILENVVGIDSGRIAEILYQKRMYSEFLPRSIKKDVSFESIAWYEEQSEFLPGVNYIVDMQRDYSFGIKGSHIFGYLKEINADQLKLMKDKYDMGDEIGFNGIEKAYEKYLRGEKGVNYFLVDSRRKTIGSYLNGSKNRRPVKGKDLVLSIDYFAQKSAEYLLQNHQGALVAIEPNTGEILALVSSPSYDLKDFASVTTHDLWKELSSDPRKPLFNRATMSVYPPGSTFKMITAIAALEEGIVNENWQVNCAGGYQYGDRFFGCTHQHGRTNLIEAIEKSCNTYFYQLILKVGLDKWNEYAKLFGFGSRTGLDTQEESSGLLPSRDYYNRVYGKNKWSNGLTLNLTIGQGELGTTPLQLAVYTAALANGGTLYQPHLVKGVLNSKNNSIEEFVFNSEKIKISERTLDIIKKGMERVVSSPEGTANLIKLPDLTIAGKTGTSQNPFGKNHAVFVGYAPVDNPQIAIAVLVENIGYGSTFAAPIARDVIDAYINGIDISDQNEKEEIKITENN